MINHILAASRIPWVLEQKGIEVERSLLSVNIDRDKVDVQIYQSTDIMKFENWTFKSYENELNGYAGELIANYEGIQFTTCVKVEELSLIEG